MKGPYTIVECHFGGGISVHGPDGVRYACHTLTHARETCAILNSANAAGRAELEPVVKQLAKVLKSVEFGSFWRGDDGHRLVVCPYCDSRVFVGHSPECGLSAALAAAEAAMKETTP